MLLIIMFHFVYHGNFYFQKQSLNHLWVIFWMAAGKVGVNIFVLISGYFMSSQSRFSGYKISKLWLQIFFYSALFLVLFTSTIQTPVHSQIILDNLMPVTYGTYWFVTAYFVMYLLAPGINILIRNVSHIQYKKMLLLLTFIWCIIPSFFDSQFGSNSVLWFIYLYLLAGYCRKYLPSGKAVYYITGAVLCWLVSFLLALRVVGGTDSQIFHQPKLLIEHLLAMNNLLVLLISWFLFMGFKALKIAPNKLINLIATSTFGIYLIHDNIFMRSYLWEYLFKNNSYTQSNWLIPYSIGVVLLVFIVCSAIELIRILLLERSYTPLLKCIVALFYKWRRKIFSLRFLNTLKKPN